MFKSAMPLEMSIAPLRSFVSEPMSYGSLFLAGDAAHIETPTGAKGLNLGFAETRRLALALASWKSGNDRPLEMYGPEALARVWKVERFSWYITSVMHQFPDHSPFESRMQRAEFDYIHGSEAAQTAIGGKLRGAGFLASPIPVMRKTCDSAPGGQFAPSEAPCTVRPLALGASSKRPAAPRFLHCGPCEAGAPRETRTPDPLITNQMLYQLSYRGTRVHVAMQQGSEQACGVNGFYRD